MGLWFLQFIRTAGGIEIQSQILENLNNSFQIATAQLQTILQQSTVHHFLLNCFHHFPPSPLPINPKKKSKKKNQQARINSTTLTLKFSLWHFNKHLPSKGKAYRFSKHFKKPFQQLIGHPENRLVIPRYPIRPCKIRFQLRQFGKGPKQFVHVGNGVVELWKGEVSPGVVLGVVPGEGPDRAPEAKSEPSFKLLGNVSRSLRAGEVTARSA